MRARRWPPLQLGSMGRWSCRWAPWGVGVATQRATVLDACNHIRHAMSWFTHCTQGRILNPRFERMRARRWRRNAPRSFMHATILGMPCHGSPTLRLRHLWSSVAHCPVPATTVHRPSCWCWPVVSANGVARSPRCCVICCVIVLGARSSVIHAGARLSSAKSTPLPCAAGLERAAVGCVDKQHQASGQYALSVLSFTSRRLTVYSVYV